MGAVAYVDIETAGLHADLHAFWEVSLITPGQAITADGAEEWTWLFELTDEELYRADPIGLGIGRFHNRHPQGNAWPHEDEYGEGEWVSVRNRPCFAREFARLTHGQHLVGHVVSFDEERLRRFLLAHGAQPSWHYHIVDVEAMAVGFIRGQRLSSNWKPALPWNSEGVSRACGVDPPTDEERHTGIGDARWARRLYERITA